MSPSSEITLFLWLEGFFPKIIAYYLLHKGLVNSPGELYKDQTNDPNLKIRVLFFNGGGFSDASPEDPKPSGKSMPCVRIIDKASGETATWIHESSAILRFLEERYPQEPRMMGATALDRAKMQDCLAAIYQGFQDCTYYIKNAASVTTSWSGLRNEDRSLALGLHAKASMTRSLSKVQDWAFDSLQDDGWLTVGVQGPGLVDVTLAAGVRYMWLSYSLDLFEDEGLQLLRRWYEMFTGSQWWDELEESGRFPEMLSNPASCREV